MITLQDIREGSTVVVRPGFAQFPPITVTVKEVEADIKNGRPGITYGENWAYLYQVERVVAY